MTIHTYFCPNCSLKVSEDNSKVKRSFISENPNCPDCQTSVIMSGYVFVILGLFIAVFSLLLLCCDADKIGMLFWVPLFVLGIMRLTKEHLAYKRNLENKST